jgi:hypothetical protein
VVKSEGGDVVVATWWFCGWGKRDGWVTVGVAMEKGIVKGEKRKKERKGREMRLGF